MSGLVTFTEVRQGLREYQTRIDVRTPGSYDTQAERHLLARTFAKNHTPSGWAVEDLLTRWAVNTDFLPGFIMSLKWFAEEITPNPTPTT